MFTTPSPVVLVGVMAAVSSLAWAQSNPPVPGYTVESRWVVSSDIGGDGAASIVLTLQSRGVVMPGEYVPDGVYVGRMQRFGNFGITSVGYGRLGASQPTTITRTGAGTTLYRGSWGEYPVDVNEQTGEPIMGVLRGAAPGASSPYAGAFGMRRFGGWDLDDLNAEYSPPADPVNSRQNGGFDAQGNLTGFNLLRTDINQAWSQRRIGLDADGGAAWMNIYRVRLESERPLIPGGTDVTVNFHGWTRVGQVSAYDGVHWFLTEGNTADGVWQRQVENSATFGFSFAPGSALVPAPGVIAPLTLAGLLARRRR